MPFHNKVYALSEYKACDYYLVDLETVFAYQLQLINIVESIVHLSGTLYMLNYNVQNFHNTYAISKIRYVRPFRQGCTGYFQTRVIR